MSNNNNESSDDDVDEGLYSDSESFPSEEEEEEEEIVTLLMIANDPKKYKNSGLAESYLNSNISDYMIFVTILGFSIINDKSIPLDDKFVKSIDPGYASFSFDKCNPPINDYLELYKSGNHK